MLTLAHAAMDKVGTSLADPENEPRREALMDAPVSMTALPPALVADMKALWADAGIQETFQRRAQFQLNDSAEYYFANLDRIGASSYVPTEQDVLRSRVKTTGIQEITFQARCAPSPSSGWSVRARDPPPAFSVM